MSAPTLTAPRPYPGCGPCTTLMRTWAAVTEPASPEYDWEQANRIAAAIADHRRTDEATAPAL